MWKIPVLSGSAKAADRKAAGEVFCTRHDLPDFYMSDYSIVGLLVDNLDEAARILTDARLPLWEKPFGLLTEIEDPNRLNALVGLLVSGGIGCEIADLVYGVYQG